MVRSANYMKKKKKIESGKMLFRLVHTEIVKSRKGCISSASQTPGTWYSNHKELIPGDSFLLVLNLQLRSLATNVISYHLMDDDHHAKELKSGNPSARLLRKLLSPDTRDVWRDSRIKMIPRIIEAPFVVRMAVSSRPVIIGRKVSCKYHMSGKYAEIKCNLDSSSVAAAAIKLAHKWSTKIVCELVWLLEGQNIKELPEQLLAGIRLDRIAFNLARKLCPTAKVMDVPEHRSASRSGRATAGTSPSSRHLSSSSSSRRPFSAADGTKSGSGNSSSSSRRKSIAQ